MEQIQTALLSGQRQVTVNSILIELQPLKRDTQAQRERMALAKAKEIFKLITN